MSHPRHRLRDGEIVYIDTRPHWWYFARPASLLLGSILIAIVILVTTIPNNTSVVDELNSPFPDIESDNAAGSTLDQLGPQAGSLINFDQILQVLAGILILSSIAILIISIVSWYFTNFFVSSDRVVNRSGILNRQGVEIPIDRINTVFFEQNVIERIIGAGDVLVESAGESGAQRFHDIAKPLQVQEVIQDQIEATQSRRAEEAEEHVGKAIGKRIEPSISNNSSSNESIPSQISQLNSLKEQGILTEEEFTRKKAELLSRM